jgi:protease-4
MMRLENVTMPQNESTAAAEAGPVRGSFLCRTLRWSFRTLLLISLLANALLLYLVWPGSESEHLAQRFHSGDKSSKNKIAIVRVEGLIAEVFSSFVGQQLRDAAQDDQVKAVVLLINSPGGSVTASDQIWKQVMDLRDGKWDRQAFPKPIVVSMESIAASGGYYIAAPAQKIYAQPTTVTGSIGVYASLLDLHVLAEKYGIGMNIITRGELKGSSMFHELKPEERREYDEMIGHSYERFMAIVKQGRGARLKHGLRDELKLPSQNGEPFVRRLADGGVFTADQAKQFGLIDEIGYLDDAVKEAKSLAGLSEAQVVMYSRPLSLTQMILGARSREPEGLISLKDIPGATAQAWYLAPGYEFAGVRVTGSVMQPNY